MNIIVAGGGKVGYYLVKALLEKKHRPVVIEIDDNVSRMIANEMDIPVISGDATKCETLCEANIFKADVFVSVTGSDESNLIACQIAKNEFGVKKTVSKSNDPRNVSVMCALGIDHVINSTDNIAAMIEREVYISRIKEIMQLDGEHVLIEVTCPDDYIYDGKMLMDMKLPQEINIISVTRNGQLIIPRGHTMLKSRDKVLIISDKNADKHIKSGLKIKVNN